MQHTSPKVGRRALLTGAALTAVAAAARAQSQTPAAPPPTRLADAPLSPQTTITVERRDQFALIGLNRPFIQNRLDPPTRVRLAETLYQYEHDPSLRALVLFGHGENFSRGIDVDASQAAIAAGRRTLSGTETVDPLGKSKPHLTKPVVVVVHGDAEPGTRALPGGRHPDRSGQYASARTRTRTAGFPEAARPCASSARRVSNAMRYMLTGDHWSAENRSAWGSRNTLRQPRGRSRSRMVMAARSPPAAVDPGDLESAHLVVDRSRPMRSKLDAQHGALYRTEDFLEGRRRKRRGALQVPRK
jgi:enoyl-CoA hydratase/carnithine racemase